MEEWKSFFGNPCPSNSQVIKLKSPLTNGFRITRENELDDLDRREGHRHAVIESGTDYVHEIRRRENELYVKNEMEREKYHSVAGGLDSLERLSSFGASIPNIRELTEEAMTEVYSKYSFQRKEETNNLPITEYKQQVIDRINSYPVVIIQGPTGCGKTTQVPQWILDNCYQQRQACKIIVTQPRRIAAISIAKRVAHERGWDVGGLVGYQVGLDNTTSTDTRISYVTTGVLLQKLVGAKNLNEFTHIILDEVHERGQEMDFLLLVVKKLLYTVSPKVKIILMSATFDSLSFANYFMTPCAQGMNYCSVVQIEKKEHFTVKTFYLNHLDKFGVTGKIQEAMSREPCILPEMNHLVLKLINAFEVIDAKEDHITDRNSAELPSVLVFLPGINEIEDLYACLTDTKLRQEVAGGACAGYNWWVLPLHSTITADEQVRVFKRAKPGERKIILATNIAESSITVPDIKYVVDFCLMKMLVADPSTNFTSLQLNWAAKTNCEQRAGRAGRVRDGRVYRLVTENFYESLKEDCMPEIQRCPLERLVLLAKMLDMGPPRDILALAMDAPDISNVYRTILVLKELGALRKSLLDEPWCTTDGDITDLGRIMAKLPIDVRASKLIMLGYIYDCLEESIIMAASMSVKNVFSNPFRKQMDAYNSKLTWADGCTSDCIAVCNVYKVWSMLRKQQHIKQQGNTEEQWARNFYVQARALRELDELVRELKARLSREGIEIHKGRAPWDKDENALMLKIILAGAVYPQYFVQILQNEEREREAVRTLGGHDPRNTVYLRNFPDNQPGPLYAAAIKKAIFNHIREEPRVSFDSNSKKVYLTFEEIGGKRKSRQNDPSLPGQVVLPVYKAVKARQLKLDTRLPLLPVEKANALAAELEMEKLEINITKMVPRLPDIDQSHFQLRISELISVSKFWVQYDDGSTDAELRQIQTILKRAPLLAYTGTVRAGQMFAGPYEHNRVVTMYRVRVIRFESSNMVEVIYIDYGNKTLLNTSSLMEMPPGPCTETPPLAMQCTLAGIAPSPLLNQHAQWVKPAERLFAHLTAQGALYGKVYSVTHGVVSIELLADNYRINVNECLVREGYAVRCEESYDSKLNHDLRETVTELNMSQKRAFNREQQEMAFYSLRELEPPKLKDCVSDVLLKGPYSPLETVVHNLMYANRECSVTIEWNSVNSVLLDTAPQENYQRMLVAADVGQNETSSKLTLRHTTLMPNIPGLPAIIALLFCPSAELRRDAQGTRYVSVLCGLGSLADGTPLFPEHDLLVNIDADIDTVAEIEKINHTRYLMDYLLANRDTSDEDILKNRTEATKLLRQNIIELLNKKRTHREPEVVPHAWEWRSVPEQELLAIDEPQMVEAAVIYPLHQPQELKPLTTDQLRELKEDNDQLKLIVTRSVISSATEVTCKLCNVGPLPVHAMRIHLYSNAHCQRETVFDIFNT